MINRIENNQDPDMLRIEYMPGNLCNHRCHYCFPGSNEGNVLWPDVNLVKQNISHLLDVYKRHGKTKSNLYIVGGEPTLWNGLEELCSYLKDRYDIIIEMSTNGTRKIDWWKRNAKNFDHVEVSVHREFANINHLINVCDTLYESGVFVNADVLMDPSAFDECVSNAEQLKNSLHEWPIIAKVVHFNGTHKYSDNELEYFKDVVKRYPSTEWFNLRNKKALRNIKIYHNDDSVQEVKNDNYLIMHGLNKFKGWTCNLGVDFIKIFSDGRITGNCQQKVFGNLYEPNFDKIFNPIITPIICSRDTCVCSEETVINKHA
jgi:MoaA/NifB/PqqE/SkfB family radical SAM enzyme